MPTLPIRIIDINTYNDQDVDQTKALFFENFKMFANGEIELFIHKDKENFKVSLTKENIN